MNTSIEVTPSSSFSVELASQSVDQTIAVGRQLGAQLERGDLILLIGAFGAGKTHLTKGIAQGLGATELATSPSFVLINEYRASVERGRFPIYHVDLYRLDSRAEIIGIGLDDALSGDGVCVIEWAEKALEWLPAQHLAIYLRHLDDDTRALRFEPHGERFIVLVHSLQNAFAT